MDCCSTLLNSSFCSTCNILLMSKRWTCPCLPTFDACRMTGMLIAWMSTIFDIWQGQPGRNHACINSLVHLGRGCKRRAFLYAHWEIMDFPGLLQIQSACFCECRVGLHVVSSPPHAGAVPLGSLVLMREQMNGNPPDHDQRALSLSVSGDTLLAVTAQAQGSARSSRPLSLDLLWQVCHPMMHRLSCHSPALQAAVIL